MRFLFLFLMLMFASCADAAPKFAKHQLHAPPLAIVGTNMGSINSFNPEQPFLNRLKQGPFWGTSFNGGSDTSEGELLYRSFLDSNGYPTTLTGGPAHTFNQVTLAVFLNLASEVAPFFYYTAGDYLLQWNGNGEIDVSLDASVTCTTSPCKVTVASPSVNGLFLRVVCSANTGSVVSCGGTTPMTKLSLIYCGTYTSGNPTGQKCSVTDPANSNKHVDALLTECEDPVTPIYTSCLNPDLTARLKGAKLLRFMQWGIGVPNSIMSSWTQRHVPTWYSWADSRSSIAVNGVGAGQFFDGIPYEIQIALCNVIGASCWFCVPPLADDTFITNLGTLVGQQLNAPLKPYVEFANEIWNFVQANGNIGTITGFVDDGSGGGSPSGVAGKKLTVTAITTNSSGGTPKLNGTKLVLSGISDGTIQIESQDSGSAGGTGVYTTSGTTGGGNLLLNPGQTISVNVDVNQNLDRLGQQNYSSLIANSGGGIAYGEYLRAVQTGHLFKTAFVAAGGSGSRVVRVAAGQMDCDNCETGSNCILQAPPSSISCGAFTGGPSEWYSGSGATQLHAEMDAFALAPYFGYGIPVAWSADADTGLTRFFAEMINGGQEPTANVPGDCGNGAGKTCTPVDTAHYTATSGQSLSSDPPNGTSLMVVMNANNTLSSGQSFIKFDTMTSYPIFEGDGTCTGTNLSAGELTTNQVVVFTFTSALNSAYCGGVVTKGWRAIGRQWVFTPGMINDIINAQATTSCGFINSAGGASYPFVAYEGGFGSTVATPGNFLDLFYISAMRDSRMGTAYDAYFKAWAAMTGGCMPGTFTHYNDVYAYRGQYWGLLENIIQTSAPRYDVVHRTYWGQH